MAIRYVGYRRSVERKRIAVGLESDSNASLTEAQCAGLVNRYLAGQGWQLMEAAELAAEIWHHLSGEATHSAVQTEILRRYAALLHHCCRQPETAEFHRAWQELKTWLEKSAARLESHPNTRQEIVQETLIALHDALSNAPLKSPQTFLIFAFQTMRRRHIDRHRRQTAEKRDYRTTVPLEEFGSDIKFSKDWTEYLSASLPYWRTIEATVSNQEVRRKLLQFAHEHLPTELQQQVFEAHFLDGLKPAEIAQLLGKEPHEIRLVKSRIVRKMKDLPPAAAEQLQEILGRTNGND